VFAPGLPVITPPLPIHSSSSDTKQAANQAEMKHMEKLFRPEASGFGAAFRCKAIAISAPMIDFSAWHGRGRAQTTMLREG